MGEDMSPASERNFTEASGSYSAPHSRYGTLNSLAEYTVLH